MGDFVETLDGYCTVEVAAAETGIRYKALLQRIARGKVSVKSVGRMKFIHKDEVARLKQEQAA